MEQTQRQSQQITSSNISTSTSTKPAIRNTAHAKPRLARTWSAPAQVRILLMQTEKFKLADTKNYIIYIILSLYFACQTVIASLT